MLLGQQGILACIAICASGFETGYTMRGRDINMDITGVAVVVAVAVTDLCWWSFVASTTDISRSIRVGASTIVRLLYASWAPRGQEQ
jgi:hypothetical protein